jgi:hypothetical protein
MSHIVRMEKEKKSLVNVEDEIGIIVALLDVAFIVASQQLGQGANSLLTVLDVASEKLTAAGADLGVY